MTGKIDRVRVLYWYRFVGRALGTLAPRELHLALEPNSLSQEEYGSKIPNIRYLNYSRGRQKPQTAVVNRVDQIVPGSRSVLTHVLWQILCYDKLVTVYRAKKWIGELPVELRRLVIDSSGEIRLDDDRHYLESLERRASLDVVAILSLLIKLGYDTDRSQRCLIEHTLSLLRVLLILGEEFNELDISEEVFQLFVEDVFQRALSFHQAQYDFRNYRYANFARMLHAEAAERVACTENTSAYIRMLVKILRGQEMALVTLLYTPAIGPDLRLGPPSLQWLEFLAEQKEDVLGRVRLFANNSAQT